jgi:hypothetical protein
MRSSGPPSAPASQPPAQRPARRPLSPEWVADQDTAVILAVAEVLRVRELAAEFLGAAEDPRVPECRPGSLVDIDGREHILSGRSVHVPVSEIVDDPCGCRGGERLGDPCRSSRDQVRRPPVPRSAPSRSRARLRSFAAAYPVSRSTVSRSSENRPRSHPPSPHAAIDTSATRRSCELREPVHGIHRKSVRPTPSIVADYRAMQTTGYAVQARPEGLAGPPGAAR